MKKTLMKKALASMTAFAAVFTMTISTAVHAVDSHTIDTPPAHTLTVSSETANIPINKDIVLFNSEGLYVPEPNIVYQYEISEANVTNAEIVTHESSTDTVTHLAVRPGVLEAITAIVDGGDSNAAMISADDKKTGTITFGAINTPEKKTNITASVETYYVSADYKYTRNMTLTVDASKIYMPTGATQPNAPGVYRYKITDVTSDETYLESGVKEGSAGDTIYLDVYVKNNAENNGLVVYGYVLLKETVAGDDISITYTEEEIPETVKIEGYVTNAEGDDNNDGTIIPRDLKSDTYTTYNVHIEKQVVGDLADRNHKFPFTIELTNDTIKNCADFSVNDGATHTNNALSATGAWDSVTNQPEGINFTFKHGDVFNLIGLPAGTKIKVCETNDTNDIYAVSMVSNGDTSLDLVKHGSDTIGKSISAELGDAVHMNEAYAIRLETVGDRIIVLNTLRDISVTGLLWNVAPFIFITAAGVALIMIYLYNKRKNASEQQI